MLSQIYSPKDVVKVLEGVDFQALKWTTDCFHYLDFAPKEFEQIVPCRGECWGRAATCPRERVRKLLRPSNPGTDKATAHNASTVLSGAPSDATPGGLLARSSSPLHPPGALPAPPGSPASLRLKPFSSNDCLNPPGERECEWPLYLNPFLTAPQVEDVTAVAGFIREKSVIATVPSSQVSMIHSLPCSMR